jgi:hypothetical protein
MSKAASNPTFQQLYREEVQDFIMRHRAEKLAEISAYTHAVTYMSNGELCHLGGSLEYCRDFAADCRGCEVVEYTEDMRDADIKHAMAWRPYTAHFRGSNHSETTRWW